MNCTCTTATVTSPLVNDALLKLYHIVTKYLLLQINDLIDEDFFFQNMINLVIYLTGL